MNIKLQPRLSDQEIEKQARTLLATGNDTGNDDILDRAIQIAHQEDLDITIQYNDKSITADMAYRLRQRGLDIRPHQ